MKGQYRGVFTTTIFKRCDRSLLTVFKLYFVYFRFLKEIYKNCRKTVVFFCYATVGVICPSYRYIFSTIICLLWFRLCYVAVGWSKTKKSFVRWLALNTDKKTPYSRSIHQEKTTVGRDNCRILYTDFSTAGGVNLNSS